MPIPKPEAGESKEDFIQRCMGNDTMNSDFPDNSQRYAVCQSQFEKKDTEVIDALKEFKDKLKK